MKVYKVTHFNRDSGCSCEWHATKRSADKAAAGYRRQASSLGDEVSDPVIEPIGTYAVNIPTDRVGLLRWLNCNFTSENG